MPRNSRSADTLELPPLRTAGQSPPAGRAATPRGPGRKSSSSQLSPGSGSSRSRTGPAGRNAQPPIPRGPRPPSPFRRHSRDIRAVSLVVIGIVILISLTYGGPALALGTFLHALLGWGAPALGSALILAGFLTALGPVVLRGVEVRVGAFLLLAGFMLAVGLSHFGRFGADGGDLGNGAASGLVWGLARVVGERAAYGCAITVAVAVLVVGLVMVTDRPLMHWANLLRALLRLVLGRCYGWKTARASLASEREHAIQERTRRERGPRLPDPDPRPTGRRPLPLTDPFGNDLPALRVSPEYSPEEDANRTTVIRSSKPPRSTRATFASTLDKLLPPPTVLPDLEAGSTSPHTVSLEDLLTPNAAEEELSESSAADAGELSGQEPAPRSRRKKSAEGAATAATPSDGALPVFTGLPELPPSTLLKLAPPMTRKSAEESNATVHTLERTLQEFKVDGQVVEIAEGPTLTRYEIRLAPGILVKRIVSLADNIAMALEAIEVRVEAPIPGKSAIGVEVPKRVRGMVGLREIVETQEFRQGGALTFALGRDVTGAAKVADLAKMPHLLIAGSTGSGKSACLNTLITSLLFRATPDQVQFMMIDPKRVELSLYDGIPHLCHQIVRDSKYAPKALARAMAEMDRRYLLLQSARTRDLIGYNNKMERPEERLPYIVVVIDELADLMMTSGAETEYAITRLAQLARAVGIHLVVATQRPSVNIVTGKIKANISSRIAFAVSSGVDSRTILDSVGAERLVGRGDMLFIPIDASKPVRVQGAFIGEQELEQVVEYWRAKGKPDYYLERTPLPEADLEKTGDADDDMYSEAVRVVIQAGQASTSMLQRKLKIGYNRAATLIELMEEHGIVGAQDGVRPREVLVSRDQWELSRE